MNFNNKYRKAKKYELPLIARYRYFMSTETNQLVPMMLPRDGDTVLVNEKPMPKGKGNVIVCEDWTLTDQLYLMSLVYFWQAGMEYIYQIQPTEYKKIGMFILTSKVPMERLSERTGSKSSFLSKKLG